MIDLNQRRQPVDPERADALIRTYCEDHGLPCPETFTPTEAAELLSRLDYVCSRGTIAEFQRKEYIKFADPDALTTVDIFCLTAALESRRRWKAAPSQHDWKKSAVRLHVEQLAVDGVEEPIADADKFTVEDLLLWLTTTEHRPTREALYETIRQKLTGYEE